MSEDQSTDRSRLMWHQGQSRAEMFCIVNVIFTHGAGIIFKYGSVDPATTKKQSLTPIGLHFCLQTSSRCVIVKSSLEKIPIDVLVLVCCSVKTLNQGLNITLLLWLFTLLHVNP